LKELLEVFVETDAVASEDADAPGDLGRAEGDELLYALQELAGRSS